MSWNSLCALGFHSVGYMLSPGNSQNEARRAVATRENSLARDAARSGPAKCPCPQCCSLWPWKVSLTLGRLDLVTHSVSSNPGSHFLVFGFLLFRITLIVCVLVDKRDS